MVEAMVVMGLLVALALVVGGVAILIGAAVQWLTGRRPPPTVPRYWPDEDGDD